MKETSKMTIYRQANGYIEYFVGKGIDIGCGDDPLSKEAFPGVTSLDHFDKHSGDAQTLSGIEDRSYDFVYSSHCLEHLPNPYIAFFNWLRICKVGGYLIVAVPHELFYEKGHWPSRFNGEHKTSWSLEWKSNLPASLHLPEFLERFGAIATRIRLETILNNFDFTRFQEDQTMGNAICQIEFVLRKGG